MKTVIIILTAASISVVSTRGQGFENLDFESAQNLPANPGNGQLVSVTSALPDWTAYDGPNVLSSIYYVNNLNNVTSSVELEGGSLALTGNNLSVGLYFNGAAISQTGLVPGNAESLQFEATGYVPILQVSLGGQLLSYSTLSAGPDYTVYGANIPAGMAGQMEALTFDIEGPGISLLDDVVFSPSVPEPSACALLGFGAMLFSLCRWRNQHREHGRPVRGGNHPF